jgi:hypothetical protein
LRPTHLVAVALAAFVLALLAPAAAEPRVALTDACVRSLNSESCDRLGDMVERGHLAARYPEEAGLYFALACEGGLARSCRRAQAWATHYSDYETLEIDVGCMLRRNGFACEEVANALRDEREEGVGSGYLAPCSFEDAARAGGVPRWLREGRGPELSGRKSGLRSGLRSPVESTGGSREGRKGVRSRPRRGHASKRETIAPEATPSLPIEGRASCSRAPRMRA